MTDTANRVQSEASMEPTGWPDYARTAEALDAYNAAAAELGTTDTAESSRLYDLEQALMAAYGEDYGRPIHKSVGPAQRLDYVRGAVKGWRAATSPEAQALYAETLRTLGAFLALDLEPMLGGRDDDALMEALVPIKDLVIRPDYPAIYKRVVPSPEFKEFTMVAKVDLLRLTGKGSDVRWAEARERRKAKGLA